MRLLPLFCLLFILLLSLVFPFQLASEQNGTSVAPSTSINISHTTQHPATVYLKPTITPAMVTKQGACNMPVLGLWGVCATQVPAGGVKGTGTLINPLPGSRITQLYGLPEFQHWCYCISPHTGLDLAAPPHTPVLAADSGQVLWSGWDWSGLGWAVKIDHGNYVATVYGHMERVIVQAGQNVQQGEVIGYEGSTGDSTGPHLHFMVVLNNTWQDPLPYISQF
ncbi:M23 family metallopeptidase [Thermosporothrix hazakensis]|jgi:murein DD-endopeptidase MepM/ murein hydrolase activator NlpD|nr:M23 family metallopeptidase [Thermosporothrix hazakensis]